MPIFFEYKIYLLYNTIGEMNARKVQNTGKFECENYKNE
jgi:hypothetical protein